MPSQNNQFYRILCKILGCFDVSHVQIGWKLSDLWAFEILKWPKPVLLELFLSRKHTCVQVFEEIETVLAAVASSVHVETVTLSGKSSK